MGRAAESPPGDSEDENRGKKNRRVTRRSSLIPLASSSSFIHPVEERQIFKIIDLAEAAVKAEAARRASGKLLADKSLMPSFGSDVSHLSPSDEQRRLVAFIESQFEDLHVKLIAVTWLGRENVDPTPEVIETLLERAHEMREHAGSYLAGQSRLVMYLRRGLMKLHNAERRRR